MFAMPNNRILIRIDGGMQALDVVIPDKREISYDDLVAYGSLVDTDPRRSVGWNP